MSGVETGDVYRDLGAVAKPQLGPLTLRPEERRQFIRPVVSCSCSQFKTDITTFDHPPVERAGEVERRLGARPIRVPSRDIVARNPPHVAVYDS